MRIQVGPLDMDFGLARLLGMAGAALFLLGLLPLLGILGIVGVILLLLSLYYFSKYYSNPSIFWNYVYSIVLGIVAVIAIPIIFLVLMGLLAAAAPGMEAPPDLSNPEEIHKLGILMLGAGILYFVLFVFAALLWGLLLLASLFFYYRSLSAISVSSGVGLFRFAGLSAVGGAVAIVIGAILAIILIGFLFMFLGALAIAVNYILLIAAFYLLKEPAPPAPQPPAQQPPVPA